MRIPGAPLPEGQGEGGGAGGGVFVRAGRGRAGQPCGATAPAPSGVGVEARACTLVWARLSTGAGWRDPRLFPWVGGAPSAFLYPRPQVYVDSMDAFRQLPGHKQQRTVLLGVNLAMFVLVMYR